MTPLDTAHDAMESTPQNEEFRRQFYGLLAGSEVFLVLEAEAQDDKASPLLLNTDDGPVALVFDTEERLAAFSDQPVPYLALSGRRIVAMLAQKDIALGFNLIGAPSAIVLPVEVLNWIKETLVSDTEIARDLPKEITAPRNVSEAFLKALDERLASLSGLASKAFLVQAEQNLMLGLTDVPDAAQGEILQLLSEARNFAAPLTELNIAFVQSASEAEKRLSAKGLVFEIPKPVEATKPIPAPPGSDPSKPPRLRNIKRQMTLTSTPQTAPNSRKQS